MKKALVILMMLLVFAGSAFAQDFAGYTWIGVTPIDSDSNDSYGVYSQLAVSHSADGFGYKANVYLYPGSVDVSELELSYSMLDGMASALVGKIADYTFRLRHSATASSLTYDFRSVTSSYSGNGYVLTVSPIEGLKVGAFVPVNDTALVDDLQAAIPGLSYTMADLFKVTATYKLASNDLAAMVNVLAVEGLTLNIGTVANLDSSAGNVTAAFGYTVAGIDLVEEVGFGYGSATTWQSATQFIYGLSDSLTADLEFVVDSDISFRVNPALTYAFGNGDVIVGFEAAMVSDVLSWSVPVEFEYWF